MMGQENFQFPRKFPCRPRSVSEQSQEAASIGEAAEPPPSRGSWSDIPPSVAAKALPRSCLAGRARCARSRVRQSSLHPAPTLPLERSATVAGRSLYLNPLIACATNTLETPASAATILGLSA